jgi:hypothetical protein
LFLHLIGMLDAVCRFFHGRFGEMLELIADAPGEP